MCMCLCMLYYSDERQQHAIPFHSQSCAFAALEYSSILACMHVTVYTEYVCCARTQTNHFTCFIDKTRNLERKKRTVVRHSIGNLSQFYSFIYLVLILYASQLLTQTHECSNSTQQGPMHQNQNVESIVQRKIMLCDLFLKYKKPNPHESARAHTRCKYVQN